MQGHALWRRYSSDPLRVRSEDDGYQADGTGLLGLSNKGTGPVSLAPRLTRPPRDS